MKVTIEIGQQKKFLLEGAILIYEEQLHKQECFATVHKVIREGPEPQLPVLGPGSLLTTSFLRELTSRLRIPDKARLLPENVLAYTSELVVWWTPPRLHPMYFSDGAEDRREVDGRICPHPALVWKVRRGQLFLRALSAPARPQEKTALMVAPYWNTAPQSGDVCEGSMPRPEQTDLSSLLSWEEGFFNSRFTHPSGFGKLTTHQGGFIGLWTELVGKQEFPVHYLARSTQTIEEFIES